MSKMIRRTFNGEVKSIQSNRVTVYVSTESIDSYNEVVLQSAWDLNRYAGHPVFLSSHNYDTLTAQIGKAIDFGVDDKGLWMTFEYFIDAGNFEADWAYKLAQENIAAFSVGFIPKKTHDGTKDGKPVLFYDQAELIEVSQVLIPANADARQEGALLDVIKSFIMKEKGYIPFKHYPLLPEGTKWDASKEVKKATIKDLLHMCTWYDDNAPDEDGDGYPDAKSAYKLPHHIVDGYKTVWKGVATAMASVLGARGGVKVPDSVRKRMYNHLSKHYEEFGKEIPEFKKYKDDEEIFKACLVDEKENGVSDTNAPQVEQQEEQESNEESNAESKSGKVLSEKTIKVIQNAIEQINNSLKALTVSKKTLIDLINLQNSASIDASEMKSFLDGILETLK